MSNKETLSAREESIKAIMDGGSVLLGNVQYTLHGNPDTGAKSLKELPSEAEFALGNPEAEKLALENIEVEMARLEAARKKLVDAKPSKAKEEKTEEPKEEKAKDEKPVK